MSEPQANESRAFQALVELAGRSKHFARGLPAQQRGGHHRRPSSGGWPRPEADRGCEHGLHLRQEEREGTVDAQDSVFRGRR